MHIPPASPSRSLFWLARLGALTDRSPRWRFGLVLAVVSALFASTIHAQTSPPQIDRVRVGLPAGQSGQDSGKSRNGAWSPVAITLKAGAQGHPQGVYRLRIETTDLEELTYQSTVSVPAMAANSERTVLGYIVPQGESGVFRVQLETVDGQVTRKLPKISRDGSRDVIGQTDALFFALGAGLSQLKRAAEKLDQPEGKEGEKAEVDPEAGRRQFAFAEDVNLLPDRWFGYDAVDVVVLATGKEGFVNELAQDSESARRNALLEWVRRGGQLVMSVGRNHQAVKKLLEKMPLLDCDIKGIQKTRSLPTLSYQWCGLPGHRPPLQQIEVATLAPGKSRSAHVMVREDGWPILVESSCGLGRVILVAFDLDMPPFTTWEGQLFFWKRLQQEVVPFMPVRQNAGPGANFPAMGGPMMPFQQRNDDIRSLLKRRLEEFDEVPVLSFGWVALFILFYIALVGPLDYLILKKLFKRLELTWVTFPLTVLVVSVTAYVIAYSLKGDDLRINKIDLVDIDLHEPRQVYGQTWCTLFSPRAQSYTIGLEPAADSWTAPVPVGAPGPVITLLEGDDRRSHTGMQGLFPRPYEYAEDGSGLLRVPVPVWATRSFSASWRAPVQGKGPPIGITDDIGPIRQTRDGHGLIGRLTNNLGVELRSAALFYREKWYLLGTLAPGESRRVELLFNLDGQGQNRTLSQWFRDDNVLRPGTPIAPTGRSISARAKGRSVYELMKHLMFFREYHKDGDDRTNAGLRIFDQTWRLQQLPEAVPNPKTPPYRNEAILVARTPMLVDKAEEVTEHAASPSRLWLGALPDGHSARPVVPGFLNQETYLRVFIPVSK